MAGCEALRHEFAERGAGRRSREEIRETQQIRHVTARHERRDERLSAVDGTGTLLGALRRIEEIDRSESAEQGNQVPVFEPAARVAREDRAGQVMREALELRVGRGPAESATRSSCQHREAGARSEVPATGPCRVFTVPIAMIGPKARAIESLIVSAWRGAFGRQDVDQGEMSSAFGSARISSRVGRSRRI